MGFAIEVYLGTAILKKRSYLEAERYHHLALGIDKAPFAIFLYYRQPLLKDAAIIKLKLYGCVVVDVNKSALAILAGTSSVDVETCGRKVFIDHMYKGVEILVK